MPHTFNNNSNIEQQPVMSTGPYPSIDFFYETPQPTDNYTTATAVLNNTTTPTNTTNYQIPVSYTSCQKKIKI
jgi:hypothetical protein